MIKQIHLLHNLAFLFTFIFIKAINIHISTNLERFINTMDTFSQFFSYLPSCSKLHTSISDSLPF